jgi:3-deoxy-manno-octulosonate cytidylyltransferase (CMP-KDO synthetase)
MKTVAIIPARMASERFPGKPLAKINGYSMIEHVYRRVNQASLIDDVYLATCDKEIADVAVSFGSKVIMTSSTHQRGTDRVAEAASKIDADFIINIQGDEPTVDPVTLDNAISYLLKNPKIKCLQLITLINDLNTFNDNNIVKAVMGENNTILNFSRYFKLKNPNDNYNNFFKQLGIYIFQKNFLLEYNSLDATPLEIAEGIDMLRILENNYPIHAFISMDFIGVDFESDLDKVENILKNDELFHDIFS